MTQNEEAVNSVVDTIGDGDSYIVVISEGNLSQFVKEVNSKIVDGYMPIGGITKMYTNSRLEPDAVIYLLMQPMVRNEKHPTNNG